MKNKILYLVVVFLGFAYASNVDDVKNKILLMNKNSASSQKKVDSLDAKTKDYLQEYRALNSKLATLQAYNKQLDGVILSQEKEIKSLDEQILSIEETKQSISPLEEKMVKTFAEFIQKDTPFLFHERVKRANDLNSLFEQNDISLSEKYRRIIEAYKIEYEFSNNIEAYQDDLEINGKNVKVDFLRIGRVGLYYVTLDGMSCGYYDQKEKRFKKLDEIYLKNIKNALKIAKKHSAPNVFILPINSSRIYK